MQVWRSLDNVDLDGAQAVVTIGNFDGVHRGHQALLADVVARARDLEVSAVVATFDPHPMSVIHPDSAPTQLTPLDRRLELLADLGIDGVLVLRFDNDLAHWSPATFVERVLRDGLRAAEVHVGKNFRFGHRAAGDVATLVSELGDVPVVAVPLAGGATRWSSTYIRQCLAEGDVEAAAAALGRPHRVEGPVVRGDQRGRELGYPTANLDLPPDTAIPADGVYAGWLTRSGSDSDPAPAMPAAISIGTNPTFNGVARRVEAYVLDRTDLELYGEHVAVDFLARLRDTVKFDGVEALVEQMARDVEQARGLLALTP